MLSELNIENLAVIKSAVIPLDKGFNVFTGETGAGKSVLVGGINAVLGQRITKDIVRNGTQKAIVSALFTHLPEQTVRKLDELGISHDDDEVLLTREIHADGGSAARVNSRPATVSMLREKGDTLINIHGQHDSQILLSPDKHTVILDSYGEITPLLSDYRAAFRELQSISKEMKKLSEDEKEKAGRIDFLSQRINDIGSVNPLPDEDDEVENEYMLMKGSDDIRRALREATLLLTGGEDTDDGCETMVGRAVALLDEQSAADELSPFINRLKSVKIEVGDISSELISLSQRLEFDEVRFDKVCRRRQALYELKRRYHSTLNDIIALLEHDVSELETISGSAEKLSELKEKRAQLLSDVTAKAKLISAKREEIAKDFSARVAEELKYLDMPNVKLEVAFERGKLTVSGMETAEFMISVNAGEPPKSIARIASGGELSRIMLALRNVIADKDDIPTLIFDEIDSGVSGRAAGKIGNKLKQISRIRQVVCVTHLSQLAVMADNHLLIEKNTLDGSTVTTVARLDREKRIAEIARIMGGDNITELTLRSAEEQLAAHEK